MKRQTLPPLPADIACELRRSSEAFIAFCDMPPSHQHRYLEWIGEAKKPETRRNRIRRTVMLLREHHAKNL